MKDIPHMRRVVAVMLAALSMAAHGSDGSQGAGAGAKERAHASGQAQAGSGSSPASPIEIVDSQGDETPDGDLEREFLPPAMPGSCEWIRRIWGCRMRMWM